MSLTYNALAKFLEDELAVAPADISHEAPLFSSGLIDSFALVTLMTYIETEGGFMIEPTDVNLDNFDSIERILVYAGRVAA